MTRAEAEAAARALIPGCWLSFARDTSGGDWIIAGGVLVWPLSAAEWARLTRAGLPVAPDGVDVDDACLVAAAGRRAGPGEAYLVDAAGNVSIVADPATEERAAGAGRERVPVAGWEPRQHRPRVRMGAPS